MMAKHGFWLILLVLLLSACGGNAAATLPSAQQAETALADMPLPQSEETLLAELLATETGYPTEIAVTTPTITMDALQAPIYTDIALPENITPTLTPPLIPTLIPTLTPPQAADLGQAPAATELIPTLSSPSEGSQVLLPLIISDSLVQADQMSVPIVEEVAQPNEVIIESRATPVPSAGLGRFFLPGLFCLMGIIILGLGLFMNTTSQPTGQEITAVLNIADLKPGLGLVELKGTITQAPRPLDKNVDNPLALMRLVIEENEPQVGWKVVLDRVLTTEFSLEDGTGAVWVAPDQLDLNLLGEGSFASIKQAEEALKILGLQASSAWGRGLRYRIWELRKGQSLIALGNIQQQFNLIGSSRQPIALSPSTMSVQAPASEGSTGQSVNTLLILVIALGGAALLGGLAWLLWALMR
jgi:hypothetical protein